VTRPVPLALGMAALVAGLVLAASGVSGGLLTRVGFPLAALAAGVAALLALLVRSVDGPETRTLGSDPDRPGVRRPGDDVDRKLAAADRGETVARDDLRERLETAAVAALARHLDCSRAEARERLRAGEWPENPTAAALFTGEDWRRPSVTERVRVFLGGESTFRQRFARATEALWRLRR
jgi:hypothetical protein